MPRCGRAGSYGRLISSFVSNSHTDFNTVSFLIDLSITHKYKIPLRLKEEKTFIPTPTKILVISDDVQINVHLLLRISSCIFLKFLIHQESVLLNLCNLINTEI